MEIGVIVIERKANMDWNRSDLYLVAHATCAECHGTGVRREKKGQLMPCGCASRAIFRACYKRFRDCVMRGKYRSQVSFERASGGRTNRVTWSRKEEEYMADFTLVSRRVLDVWHYRLFRFHFLLGADWKLCSRKFGVSRGNFFHAIYRIQEQLGKAFYQLEPYALYPPRDYFVLRLPGRMEPCHPPVSSAPGARMTRGEKPAATRSWQRVPA